MLVQSLQICSLVLQIEDKAKTRTLTPLMPTLKPQSNEQQYTVIGTLVVDGRAVTFSTARMRLGGLEPRPVRVPSSLYQM